MIFDFLNSKETYEPLDYEARKYFEHNFLWLIQEFPEPNIEDRKVFIPDGEDFPIKWNGSQSNALEALEIICKNMQIDINDIEIDFFDNDATEIYTGSFVLYLEPDPENPPPAGLYHDKNENGKYEISIDNEILKEPEILIATLAHELAHLKLLGEKQLEENDEFLTDFATVFYGFGIYNANSAFRFFQQTEKWGYGTLGYLRVEEWAYALALFAFIREEDNPGWAEYLSKSVKKEFKKCLEYMIENEDEIFRLDDDLNVEETQNEI